MLRFIILLILATNVAAIENITDAQLLLQVQEFAQDVNNSLPINPALVQAEKKSQTNTSKSSQLIVFISTSMPEASIKQWAKQADSLGAELVIRGFVNNSFKDTVILAQDLFAKDNVGGFNIDPLKFKHYDVKTVPTVVLDANGAIDMVQGDIGLIEALKIIRAKGTNSQDAQKYLSKI